MLLTLRSLVNFRRTMILDPPNWDEHAMTIRSFNTAVQNAQLSAASGIAVEQVNGSFLDLGKIKRIDYCKEDDGIQHEFLRAEVHQKNGKSYWIIIQRVTDLLLPVPEWIESHVSRRRYNPGYVKFPSDMIYRGCSKEEVLALARLTRPKFRILMNVAFPDCDKAPTIADLALAAKVFSEAVSDYSTAAMSYLYSMYAFELILREKSFGGKLELRSAASQRGVFNNFKVTMRDRIICATCEAPVTLVNSDTLAINQEGAAHVDYYLKHKYGSTKSIISKRTHLPPILRSFDEVSLNFNIEKRLRQATVYGELYGSALLAHSRAVKVKGDAQMAQRNAKIAAFNRRGAQSDLRPALNSLETRQVEIMPPILEV